MKSMIAGSFFQTTSVQFLFFGLLYLLLDFLKDDLIMLMGFAFIILIAFATSFLIYRYFNGNHIYYVFTVCISLIFMLLIAYISPDSNLLITNPYASDFGLFGDYIGGLLNPMVGLITIWLLLATLKQSRDAQTDAATAFEKQHAIQQAEKDFNFALALLPRFTALHDFAKQQLARHNNENDAPMDVRYALKNEIDVNSIKIKMLEKMIESNYENIISNFEENISDKLRFEYLGFNEIVYSKTIYEYKGYSYRLEFITDIRKVFIDIYNENATVQLDFKWVDVQSFGEGEYHRERQIALMQAKKYALRLIDEKINVA